MCVHLYTTFATTWAMTKTATLIISSTIYLFFLSLYFAFFHFWIFLPAVRAAYGKVKQKMKLGIISPLSYLFCYFVWMFLSLLPESWRMHLSYSESVFLYPRVSYVWTRVLLAKRKHEQFYFCHCSFPVLLVFLPWHSLHNGEVTSKTASKAPAWKAAAMSQHKNISSRTHCLLACACFLFLLFTSQQKPSLG